MVVDMKSAPSLVKSITCTSRIQTILLHVLEYYIVQMNLKDVSAYLGIAHWFASQLHLSYWESGLPFLWQLTWLLRKGH